jgi:hypothetical protein
MRIAVLLARLAGASRKIGETSFVSIANPSLGTSMKALQGAKYRRLRRNVPREVPRFSQR